ncbi:hypothetical protein IMCC12053_1398 [Celeribacter marinus]|uniref:Uncharacterized protein n=1 Tax=Celeribacter marinus TaxID=1397108 RepID=A0A0N9ZEP1_9RHOB|nr:hypothetical protein IMCC12053_1398 [Celeribacter marinus]
MLQFLKALWRKGYWRNPSLATIIFASHAARMKSGLPIIEILAYTREFTRVYSLGGGPP